MKVIKAGLLFNGISEKLLSDPIILLENDRITAVGGPDAVEVPPDAEVYDFPGMFVMPGMIDCHVHLTASGSADPRVHYSEPETTMALRAQANGQRSLAAGFTTLRSMGAPFDTDIKYRRAVESGIVSGPRVIASGRCITMTGGHGHNGGLEADGPWAVRQAVRQLLKAGADVIKLMATGGVLTEGVEPGAPELSLEELQAAICEARNGGRRTATHAQGSTGIAQAVEAGIDSVEHGCFLDDKVIDRMAAQGTALVPTLAAPRQIIDHGEEGGIPAYAVEKTKRIYEAHRHSLFRAYKAGVLIGMGTDAGTPFNYHGANAQELQYLVDAGMTTVDALRSAAGQAAAIVGRRESIGQIKEGFLADLVVLRKNPLENIKAAADVPEAVFFGGQRL